MAKAPVEAVELTDPASIKACYQAIGDAVAAGRLTTAQAFALNRGNEGWLKADEAENIHQKLKLFDKLLRGLEAEARKDPKIKQLLQRLGLDGHA